VNCRRGGRGGTGPVERKSQDGSETGGAGIVMAIKAVDSRSGGSKRGRKSFPNSVRTRNRTQGVREEGFYGRENDWKHSSLNFKKWEVTTLKTLPS